MYPTIVRLLVETQRSMVDICEISQANASRLTGLVASEARAATLGHPSFTVGPINSTMDNKPEFSPSRTLQSEDVQERGLEKVILELKESRISTGG